MTSTWETQRRLTALAYDPGPADGILCKKTIAAIKKFKIDYGLVVDGIAGKERLEAMKQAETAPKSKKPEPDKSAIQKPAPIGPELKDEAKAPPIVASLKLLDTARPIKELVWHCSATREGQNFTAENIRSWHKQRGWSDIGYHYVVNRLS